MPSHPFESTKLAGKSDLKSEAWKEIFPLLEKAQGHFLARENEFRSAEYISKWPTDALHWWSRVWEYPYVYHLLNRASGDLSRETLPTVLDVGSGVTFFPFAVADLGYKVICLDNDPVCHRDLEKATGIFNRDGVNVEARLIRDSTLPVEDESVEAVYCVSVIEHVANPDILLREMRRVLKPHGVCLITIDLDVLGNSEIGPERYASLVESLEAHFETWDPIHVTHPADILYSDNSIFPMRKSSVISRLKHAVKHGVLPSVRGQKASWSSLSRLAVQGFSLRRRESR